jgi:streptogramin lyase
MISIVIASSMSAISFNVSLGTSSPPYEVWVASYDGLGSDDDIINDIVVDSQGNSYVVGSTYVGSSTGKAYFTIKYNPTGGQEWIFLYDTGGVDEAFDVELDMQGNVYVTGRSAFFIMVNGIPERHDYYVTTKLNPSSGVLVWQDSYYSEWSRPNYLTIDEQGNVFVTGTIRSNSIAESDIITIKYSSAGSLVWDETKDNLFDVSTGIVVDSQGNVYVSGTTSISGVSDIDFLTLKYDSIGDEQWTKVYDSSTDGHGSSISLSPDENYVYVIGYSKGFEFWDVVVVKYFTSDGNVEWVSTYDNGNSEAPFAHTVDDSGYIYITGSVNVDLGTDVDVLTIKFDPSNGNKDWIKRYDMPGKKSSGYAIATDESGNVFVTGQSWFYDTQQGKEVFDVLTIKYSSDGSELWGTSYNGPANGNDHGRKIALDGWGNAYVAGHTESSDSDTLVIKYSESLSPVADAGGPYLGFEGFPIDFDGSASDDLDGSIVSYSWDFDASDGISQDATGLTPNYTYTTPGLYTVTLTVTDDYGLTSMATSEVMVITPSQATAELITIVEEMELPFGLENSLIKKLEGLIGLLNKGNEIGAVHKLEDFIDQVEAQRGKKLTDQQASDLIFKAQEIINHI